MLVSGGKILAVDKIIKDDNVLSGDGVFTPLGPKIESPDNKTYGYNPVEQTWVEAKSITTISHDTTLSGDGANDALGINLADATDENKIYGFKKDGSLNEVPEQKTYTAGYGLSADTAGTTFGVDTNKILTTADKTGAYSLTDSTTVKVIENAENKTISLSADTGIQYVAGAYIDTTKFASGEIAVSGLQPAGNYLSADALNGYATETYANNAASAASAAAVTDAAGKYQPIGDYLSANALAGYAKLTDVTSATSGKLNTSDFETWSATLDDTYQAKGNYLSANALDGVSGTWNEVSAVSSISGYGYSAWSGISAVSAGPAGKLSAWYGDTGLIISAAPSQNALSAGAYIDATEFANNIIAVSGLQPSGNYLSAADKDEAYALSSSPSVKVISNDTAKVITLSASTGVQYTAGAYIDTTDFNNNGKISVSGLQPSGNYLSANALDGVSGTWNEVSAISGYGYSAWSGISAVSAGPAGKLSAWFGETGLIISAAPSQNALSAGDWISSTELADNKIAVSGLDTIISASNGIDAQWNAETSAWDISAVKPELAYARYSTNTTTSTAGTVTIAGYNEEERYSENVTLDGNAFVMQPGLYHIDVQAIIKVNTIDDNYKTVKLIWDSEPERSVEQEIDASYVHEETISLSFDVSVSSETSTTMRLENLPAGASYTICYLNVHEITNINSDLIGSTLDIVAGDGLTKNANVLNVNIGDGLKIENNKLNVAVGTGLKLEEGLVTGELNIAIDETTEDVVKTVRELENDLAEKVTTTYSYANVTDGADITTQAASQSDGRMFGYLFSVPIKNKIYLHDDNSERETVVGIYSQKDFVDNDYAIFGIYEYDPEYTRADGTKGRTVPLCDTGRVRIKTGFNELPMKHGPEHDSQGQPETTMDFKSGCLYYATIFIPRGIASGRAYNLACCPGYAATFNANPQLSVDQANIPIRLSKEDSSEETAEEAAAFDAVSFKDFGFGWIPKEGGGYETTVYHEDYTQKRIFMQFRNKKK